MMKIVGIVVLLCSVFLSVQAQRSKVVKKLIKTLENTGLNYDLILMEISELSWRWNRAVLNL